MDEIIHADEYIKDFQTLAQEYCHSSAEQMALSVFREFTADTVCSVYLDSEQVKGNRRDYEFIFDIAINENRPIVRYTGYH